MLSLPLHCIRRNNCMSRTTNLFFWTWNLSSKCLLCTYIYMRYSLNICLRAFAGLKLGTNVWRSHFFLQKIKHNSSYSRQNIKLELTLQLLYLHLYATTTFHRPSKGTLNWWRHGARAVPWCQAPGQRRHGICRAYTRTLSTHCVVVVVVVFYSAQLCNLLSKFHYEMSKTHYTQVHTFIM